MTHLVWKELYAAHRVRPVGPNLVAATLAAVVVAGIGAVAPVSSGRAVESSTSVFGQNLIANPGAEAGPGSTDGSVVAAPAWTTTGGFTVIQYQPEGTFRFPTTTTTGPDDRGLNFFAGGPGDDVSTATQDIDVSSAAGIIDRGGVQYRMIAYLGGFQFENDSATFGVEFRDAAGTYLGSEVIGGSAGSGDRELRLFANPSFDRYVPQGTRTIHVVLRMAVVRASADGYIDGYADGLSLTLTAPPAADLAVTMTDFPDPARHNRPFTHRVEVTNLGPDSSAGSSIDVVYPRGAEVVATSVEPCGSVIPPDGDPIYTFCLGVLGSGDGGTIDLTFRAKKPGSYTTSATANDTYDPDYGNNTASATTAVTRGP